MDEAGQLIDLLCRLRPDLAAGDSEEVARLLATRLEDARTAYPELALDAALFTGQLAGHLEGKSLFDALSQLRFSQLWLACACTGGDPRAIKLLDREGLSRVPAFVARIDSSPAFADEVAQTLRAHLFAAVPPAPPGIAGYSGRGELHAWLRVLALRTAQRLKRRQRDLSFGARQEAMPDLLGAADPERDYLKLRYRGEYQDAFKLALAALSPRERLFLRLHYVDGLNIDRIGGLYRIHRSTVARHLADHRLRVLELTRARLRERLQLSESEFDSVLVLVRSELLVSIRGALS